jgi:hypothetical protein
MNRRAIFVLSIFATIALYIIVSILISNTLALSKSDRAFLYFVIPTMILPISIFISWTAISVLIIHPIIFVINGHQEDHIFWMMFNVWEIIGKKTNKWINTQPRQKINKVIIKTTEDWEQYLPEVEKAIHPLDYIK